MWNEENNSLVKEFIFKDFVEAFSFMTKVALISEQINHHPTLENTWNRVRIKLTTHDKGNTITDKDRLLAQKIDAL